MAVDFVGCWVVEKVCKALFAELQPKPMITKGRERREARRRLEEAKEDAEKAAAVVANGKVE
jgi:cation-transporting ATPase 13A1